ncbi:hypothetical protein AGLY_011626 [Aphis glycines]|uniref:Uncharacterized protein n=1 Tax=Aphis glycines TaxID=307491 RepID=A0A6G0TCY4_APHGL|nr:hypothetical protein AGLY_011626 [Aphis glycines]
MYALFSHQNYENLQTFELSVIGSKSKLPLENFLKLSLISVYIYGNGVWYFGEVHTITFSFCEPKEIQQGYTISFGFYKLSFSLEDIDSDNTNVRRQDQKFILTDGFHPRFCTQDGESPNIRRFEYWNSMHFKVMVGREIPILSLSVFTAKTVLTFLNFGRHSEQNDVSRHNVLQ